MKAQDTIIRWLGRLFSVSSIALIVSIIGVIIAIKQYHVASSGEMKLYFTNGDHKIDCTGTDVIFYLHEIEYEDPQGLIKHYQPVFKNATDVALKNISVRIVAHSQFLDNRLNTELYSINDPIYEEGNRNGYIFNFRKDFLEAHGNLPDPFKYTALDYDSYYDVDEDESYPHKFLKGTISYDEIKKPINFSVYSFIVEYIDDETLNYFYEVCSNLLDEDKEQTYKIIVGDSMLVHLDDIDAFISNIDEKPKPLSYFGKTYCLADGIPEESFIDGVIEGCKDLWKSFLSLFEDEQEEV